MKNHTFVRLVAACVLLSAITSCKQDLPSNPISLTSVQITNRNNATVIFEDAGIHIRLLRSQSLEGLILSFEKSENDVIVCCNGDTLTSGVSAINLKKSSELVLTQPGNTYRKVYPIKATTFTGLPIISIQLASGNSVQSKTTMQDATFNFDGNGNFNNFEACTVNGQIRGRGNSTWGFPKKPYKIKLDYATSIFGQEAHREWILLANYADKSLLRNEIAFQMSEAMEMPYTPYHQYVELYLNGSFQGNYQFCDEIEIGSHRLVASSLIELDMRATENGAVEGVDYFRTPKAAQPWEIKELGASTVAKLKSDMTNAENVLFGTNYTNAANGFRCVFDEETIIKWTLINELFKNVDSKQCSVYFYQMQPGGKFYKGPVWDFDLGAGNDGQVPSLQDTFGWWTFKDNFFTRMRSDTNFNAHVKEIWKQYRPEIQTIIDNIGNEADEIRESAAKNFGKWTEFNDHAWYSVANMPESFDGQVEYLKNYLQKRAAWMDTQLK